MFRLSILTLLAFPAITAAAPPAVTAVAYHPQGKLVAFGFGPEVRVFDLDNGEVARQFTGQGRVTALAFDPTGNWLAIARGEPGKHGTISAHRFGALAELNLRWNAHTDAIYALAFAPDGKTLASAGYDRVIRIWEVGHEEFDGRKPGELKAPRRELKDHSDTVYALAFNHDGSLLASGSADRSVKVWDAATGKRLYTLGDPTDWVYCLAWSPDGKHLAAGGVDKSIRVWEADKDGAKLVHAVFAHEKPIWRLTYTADGRTLYSAGEDRVVKAWNAATLTEAKVFPAQPEAILDLAVRPDGKQLAVARFDGVGLLLDPATGKPTAQPLPAKPVQPKPEKLTPSGAVRGGSTRVIVTGISLDQITKITTSVDSVSVKIIPEGRTATRILLQVTSTAATPFGTVKLTFEGEAGKAPPLAFAIDRFPAVAETGLSDSARTAQPVTLPVTLVGSIDRAGDADYYRFEAKAGDEIGVQAVTTELGSKLEPVLVLTDAGGTMLTEGTAVLGYRVRQSGTYAVGIRDKDYRGGPDFAYRLHVGNVPVVTGVFPLAAPRARTTDVHIDGVNLGSPGGIAARVTVPADAAVGSKLPVPLPAGAEKPLGAAEVVVAEFPAVVVDPVAGADLRVPGSADGILTKPGEGQLLRFTAKKGQRLVVDVLARRAGSPIDSVMEIQDAAGKPLPRALLRATAKTYTTFRDHDAAGAGIRLDTWNELAMDDYLYVGGELVRILDLPRNPDDDCQFYQVAGQRVGYLGTTPTHHSQGSPMYKVEIHPPGTTFPPNGLPVFPVYWRNDDGGPGYGKDSYLIFDPPADGTYQVRVTDARGSGGPSHAYHVTVRPPKPDFTVSFNPTAPSVWKGGAIPVNVTVTRIDGFDGPVSVRLKGLPSGFEAPPTFVEAGHTTTAFALSAAADAELPPDAKLKLVARATIDGKEVTREAAGGTPKLVGVGDIVTRTSVSEIALQPGKQTRFVVEVERQGKFAGRVPIEVRGLPHGVRVLDIGLNGILVTERETSREVVLYAEPWVRPMERPIVVVAVREGTNAQHAAKSLLLKVGK